MRRHVYSALIAFASALVLAAPALAWADNGTVTCADLENGSYEAKVADWPNEQNHIKDLKGTAVIELDEGVQGLANSGELVYTVQTWGTCDECRNITMKTIVTFYDANGAQKGQWSDGINSDYDTFRQEHTLGNSAFVPAGTTRIEVMASNHVGTKSDLELTCTFALSSTANMDPQSYENTFTATVKGDAFYDSSADASSSQTFSFDYLKDETVYASDVDLFATIYLDSVAQSIANEGYLTYVMDFTSICGECRTMENDATVRCFDANNNELTAGQWNLNEDDYETFPQRKEYISGEVLIPEGTAYLKVECSNETGTSSHLGLYGSLAVCSSKDASYWYDNETAEGTADEGKVELTVYEHYDPDGTGKGELFFTDIFKDLPKRVSADSQQELFKSALLNQNVLFNWSQLAYDIFKVEGAYWDHAEVGFDEAFGAGHYSDLVYQLTHQTDGQTDGDSVSASAWTSSSGLRQASSWNAVMADAAGNLAQQRKKLSNRMYGNITSDDLLAAHDVASLLEEKYAAPVDWEGYDGLIYYTYANSTDQRGAEQFYYYDSFILAFYDFEYAPVIDDTTYVTTVNPQSGARTVSQCTVNDTATESSIAAEYSYTESSTASNTITSARTVESSYTLGLDVAATAKFGVEAVAAAEFQFSASNSWTTGQAFTFEESASTSDTVEETFGSGSSTPLPPYTTGFVTTTESLAELRHEYDCPLSVQFKVLVIGLNGKYYDDGVGIMDMHENNTFVAQIGHNAEVDGSVASYSAASVLRNDMASAELNTSALTTCAAPESKMYAGDENLKAGGDLLGYLGTHMPMTYEDAAYTDLAKHLQYDTQVYASRPLNYTAVTKVTSNVLNEKNTIYLTPGQEYNLTNNVWVGGFNDASAEYFDFVPGEGYYKLYDANGEALPEEIAYLRKNEVNGNTYLVVATATDAKFHVVYHINDNLYSYVNGINQTYGLDENGFGNGYVNDADLTKRATIDVVVEAPDAMTAGSATEAEAPAQDAAEQPSESTAEALAGVSQRMNTAWDTLVATYGINEATVDPNAAVDESHFYGLLYAAWCMYNDDSPQTNPRDDADAYHAEAVAWAEAKHVTDLYAEGSTYADAVKIIIDKMLEVELSE